MLTSIFIAGFDSRNFWFSGSGKTPGEAFCALDRAIRIHTEQYQLADDWYDRADYSIREVLIGHGYRDETILTSETNLTKK